MPVCGVRMVATHIEIDTRGSASYPDNAECASLFRMQESGALQPVARGIGGLNQRHQITEFVLHGLDSIAQYDELVRRPISAHATDADHGAKKPASGQFFVEREHHLPHQAGMSIGDDK